MDLQHERLPPIRFDSRTIETERRFRQELQSYQNQPLPPVSFFLLLLLVVVVDIVDFAAAASSLYYSNPFSILIAF